MTADAENDRTPGAEIVETTAALAVALHAGGDGTMADHLLNAVYD